MSRDFFERHAAHERDAWEPSHGERVLIRGSDQAWREARCTGRAHDTRGIRYGVEYLLGTKLVISTRSLGDMRPLSHPDVDLDVSTHKE